MYITIDGGTTNTRINLFDNGVIDTVKLNLGARLADKDKTSFVASLKVGINTLLNNNKLREDDVEAIIASGMITSPHGLYEVPHIIAPAGIVKLKSSIKTVNLNEISNIPFSFIPGVRTIGKNYTDTDVMRGEEAEIFGINKLMNIKSSGAYVLPGSHSKLIFTNENQEICDFFTTLTGEMIASLSLNTILSSSVDLQNAKINQMLFEGYEYTKNNGINKALFKVRIISDFVGGTMDDAYSFFMGAVLFGEVEALKNAKTHSVYIGGRAQIKDAQAQLIKKYTDKSVVIVPDEYSQHATSYGMAEIFSYKI